MKSGISSWAYPWAIGVAGYERPKEPLNAFGLVERASALGVEILQIADNLRLECLSAGEITRLGVEAERAGIGLELGTRGIEPPHLALFLEFAECVNARLVRTLLDAGGTAPPLAYAEKCLRDALPAYERAGVMLAIENYEKHPVAELAALVRLIGSPYLGICLDPVNSLGTLETPADVVRELAPLAVNVHLKDFDIIRVASMMGYQITGRPAGSGRLNVPWLLAEVRQHGREASVVVEQWPPLRDTIAETVALEAEWAVHSVRYLQHQIGA